MGPREQGPRDLGRVKALYSKVPMPMVPIVPMVFNGLTRPFSFHLPRSEPL